MIMKRVLNILIACEESQAECLAFRQLGHNAFSCDIQPCRRGGEPGWHIQGDVTPFLHGETRFRVQTGVQLCVPNWDLIVAHPPCTYLSKVGSIHMTANADYSIIWRGQVKRVNRNRFIQMRTARSFFFECLNATAPFVAVENPIPMALAQLPRPSCYACPSWFGVRYTKKTLYWLKNLPPVMATLDYPNPREFVRSSRGKYRSRTFPELAAALADQWSRYILDNS